MELLNSCFEGAEYVELVQEHGHAGDAKSRTTVHQRPRPERPPRKLPEILCALGVALGAMVLGAATGQQAWVLLRLRTKGWCVGSRHVGSLGLDAAHLGVAAQAIYCSTLRHDPGTETAVAVLCALVFGAGALRFAFGRAYFVSWNEEEEMHELQRLYRTRASGEWFVLAAWKFRVLAAFFFDIVVWMWFRYYLDLYLDIQAMQIFWEGGQLGFLFSNLGGIVLGLVWTAVELYKILREGEDGDGPSLPGYQVLIVGLLIPLAGGHVTYLSILSLAMGQKHRFLFISTLAESILESAVSAFVQTYAVVFSTLDLADKADLYASIALSFISIGYAFASLDRYDGGEMLVQLPGLCRSTSAAYWAVFVFRVCEVTSRAASLALFQCVMGGWSIVYVVLGDSALMCTLAALHQLARSRSFGWKLLRSNIFFALPSCICLMTPMLEKDSPLAVQPELYYVLRAVELAGMFVLCGERLAWDLNAGRELFADDALMVATFCWSTLLMVVLGVGLRGFLAVRTLLEAPQSMWSMRAFTITQQIQRDRILSGPKPKPDDQRIIAARIRSQPAAASWDLRAALGEELPACAPGEEWFAGFLAARLSICMEEALRSLEDTFLGSRGDGLRSTPSSGILQHRAGSLLGSQYWQQHGALGPGVLRTGELIHIRIPEGGLTAVDGSIAVRWAGNQTDQKFVLEPFGEDEDQSERVLTGAPVRLRALERGRLVRVAGRSGGGGPGGEADEEAPAAGADEDPDRETALVEDEEVATAFTLALVHEEEYRTAKRFALHVRPTPGSLELASLTPTQSSERPEPSPDWVASGWRIALINGEAATKEMLAELLEASRAEEAEEGGLDRHGSSFSDTKKRGLERLASKGLGAVHALARRGSYARRGTMAGTMAADAGGSDKIRVTYEKAWGPSVAINFGDRVILRVAQEAALGEPVGLGAPLQCGKAGVEPPRALVAAWSTDPAVMTVERADTGCHDDPPLYTWAAEEIQRRTQANAVRASLSEKCRAAMTVAFNCRSVGGGWVLDGELHLRMIRLLASLVLGYREAEVRFDSLEELLEELRLGPAEATRPLVVQAVDSAAGGAAHAGVHPGDEVVELEVDRDGSKDCVIRSAKEMRRALGTTPGGGAAAVAQQPLALLFRSPAPVPVDSGILKVLVGQAGIVAQIMPSWEEILGPMPELSRGQASGNWAAASARLLRHNEFFRLKCSLVTSLLQHGWEIKYDAFAESAMTLHQHFQVLTREGFRARFPGKDDASRQLCQQLLVAQLDVLTASWAAVPKAVKEHQPAKLRKLFRHNVELVAMHDAVEIVYRTWRKQTQASDVLVEMPGELQRFLERVSPTHSVDAGSTTWIRQAWWGAEHKDEYSVVQKVLEHFSTIYADTEQYWMTKLEGAAKNMEATQEQLEKALDSADMRVALVPADKMAKELKRIQGILSADKLVLKKDLKVGDSDTVLQGMRLLRRGQVSEHFGADVGNSEVHRRLAELAPGDGTDLRLLFGGGDYDKARAQAIEAIEDLGSTIRVVKTAAAAFPSTVAVQCHELLDMHHKGEMRAVLQENKHRIQVQQKEAQEMVRTANIKLVMAEEQRRSAMEKLKEAEEERAMAEDEKKKVQSTADAWWENLQLVGKEKQKLESDKRTLEEAMSGVERDKDRLENEKLEWTKVQSILELEKSNLQRDIERAREDARNLQMSAEKWQKTLTTAKRAAEEKEAHLREIQRVIQAHQVTSGGSESSLSSAPAPARPALLRLTAREGAAQQAPAPPLGSQGDPGEAFAQLLTILGRAFNNPQGMERQTSGPGGSTRSLPQSQ